MGNTSHLPFQIQRTHLGNLPVYTEFRNDRNRKLTVVRKITGDVEEFKAELAKVVSNSPIYDKVGRVEVKGLHTELVKLWLRRLGFWVLIQKMDIDDVFVPGLVLKGKYVI